MTLITISRKLGSLGTRIGSEAANRLGYRAIRREWINEAAKRAGAPEAALAAVDELGLLGICPSPEICHAYRKEVEAVILEIAEQGSAVFIGRGAQVILRNRPGVIHFQITAPEALRAVRVAEETGVSITNANAQIQASDRFRKQYMRKFYQVDWEDPHLYHLILNTQYLSTNQCVELVCTAAALADFPFENTEIEHLHR